jgi:hypothetical protein
LIEDHRRVFVFPERLREAVQEHLHCRGIGIGQHQRKCVIRARFNGGENIGEGKPLVAEPRRTLAPLPPDMANTALLPDARLVLKEQADTLAFMRILKFFDPLRGSF